MKICKVEECERVHEAKGYCHTHYMRIIRTGAPELPEGQDEVVLHGMGYTPKRIAGIYGIKSNLIHKISAGKTWKDIVID